MFSQSDTIGNNYLFTSEITSAVSCRSGTLGSPCLRFVRLNSHVRPCTPSHSRFAGRLYARRMNLILFCALLATNWRSIPIISRRRTFRCHPHSRERFYVWVCASKKARMTSIDSNLIDSAFCPYCFFFAAQHNANLNIRATRYRRGGCKLKPRLDFITCP